MRMSLRGKLIATSLGMVLLPVVGIGGLSLYQFRNFGQRTCDQSYANLREDAVNTLSKGVQADAAILQQFLDRVEGDARTLANAATLRTFLLARQGRSDLFNNLGRQEIFRIVSGIEAACATQGELINRMLESDLALITSVRDRLEPVRIGPDRQRWTGPSGQEYSLPALTIGADILTPDHPAVPALKAINAPGRICAVFQKLDDARDMACVGGHAGEGAQPLPPGIVLQQTGDATQSLVKSILDNKPATGRCRLGGQWYSAAAVPLTTEDKQVVGMILMGMADTNGTALHERIVTTKIGKDGYVFVMDSKGELLIHPNDKLVGKNAISDLGLTMLEEALKNRTAGEMKLLNYPYEGREKFLVYTHFPEWDWILCGSGYWDDLSTMAAEAAMKILQSEVQAFWNQAVVQQDNRRQHLYSQIRLLDATGHEVYNLKGGEFTAQLGERSKHDWFLETIKLNAGEVYNSGVVIAANTGQEEIRVSSPVYVDGKLEGVVALSASWSAPNQALQARVYGQTGYCFLVDDKGILTSHPKYRFAEQVSLMDAKFGKLAEITRDQMVPGKTGCVEYEFEGVSKFVAFTPIRLGNRTYSIAAGVPEAEALQLARHIQAGAQAQTRAVTWLLLVSAAVMAVAGAAIGWWLSTGIARPIQRIVVGLDEGARQVDDASGQVSSASQQLAAGASEQASSLEETSASLEEVAAMTRNNATNASKANSMMEKTRQIVQEGNQAMTQASQAMTEISQASDQISKIIKVIEEIAFQTNLLALNAAVEAARAGEHGKGFAVVADEVRNLAQRAAAAAKETADLIAQTVERVNRGVDLNRRTSESFAEIGKASEEVAELVAQIAHASNEQAQGVEQVNAAVSQMDKITQQTASNAEESAAAAEELAAQAQAVKRLVQELSGMVTGAYHEHNRTPRLIDADSAVHTEL